MPEISDDEGRLVLWASSEQGTAAIRAAWDKAQDLDLDLRRWASCRLREEDFAEVIFAAYLAAGWFPLTPPVVQSE